MKKAKDKKTNSRVPKKRAAKPAVPSKKAPKEVKAPDVKKVKDDRPSLPLTSLVESSTNPRRTFSKESLEELANSIRQSPLGIVEPLVVRKKGSKYEIVAGARRFRAAKLAGLKAVPVTVVTLDDAAALETQIIENLQREDPHPLDEADGYAALMKMPGYSADKIAERVGKDRSYIFRRMSLAKLVEPAKKAFREGHINIQHALRIVRLIGEESQLAAYALCFPTRWNGTEHERVFEAPACGAAELDQEIAREITLKLSAAPWKLSDADVLPQAGACTDCPKRSGSHPTLFGEMKGEIESGDMCLDRSCFGAKRIAFVQVDLRRAEAAGKVLVPVRTYGRMPDYELPEGTVPPEGYTQLNGKPCDRAEKAIVVGGNDVGSKMWICRDRACPEHGRGVRSAGGSARDDAKAAQAKLEQRIDVACRDEIIRLIAVGDRKFGDIAVTGEARPLFEMFVGQVIGRLELGTQGVMLGVLGQDVPKDIDRADAERLLMDLALQALEGGRGLAFLVAISSAGFYAHGDRDRAAELLGIDVDAVRKRVAAPLIEKFEQKMARKKAVAK